MIRYIWEIKITSRILEEKPHVQCIEFVSYLLQIIKLDVYRIDVKKELKLISVQFLINFCVIKLLKLLAS